MRAFATHLNTGFRALAVFLGLGVISIAVGVSATSRGSSEIAAWAEQVFGTAFLAVFTGLILASLFCWTKLRQGEPLALWSEAGQHAAGGIAILALTFTLLGISLGIGSLNGQELTPATIQDVIARLTRYFSMAFMTTVAGLPTSAALRALIGVEAARRYGTEPHASHP